MNKKNLFILASSFLALATAGSLTAFEVSKGGGEGVFATHSFFLERYQGNTLRFKAEAGVKRYVVYDDNDYRSEITIDPSSADSDGYLYYTTEVVGNHNVYVKGYTDDTVIKSNVVKAAENLPVFDYAPGMPVFFYDLRDGSSSTYTIIKEDGSFDYVSQSDFNANYIKNRNGIMDFTTTTNENYKIANILAKIKGMGSNIVKLSGRFHDVESGSQWWWGGSFENSVLKRTMDAAWSMGLKCIVADFEIMTNSESDSGATVAQTRMGNAELKKAFKHPAFYGIELNDEPLPTKKNGMAYTEIENTGFTVRAILDAWHSDPELSSLPDPYIHTDLASYNDIADGYFDNGPEEYEAYLESWITGTGLNHLDFDYYTYTTYQYGNKKIGTSTYYYDSSKVIYDCINNLRAKHPGLVVSQTITRSNDKSRKALTAQDVYASTLLAASQGNHGYSTFTFFQDAYSRVNTPVTTNYTTTNTYTWSQGANEQYRFLTGLLDGYTLSSNEMSDYSKSYLGKTYPGYSSGVRTSTSLFANVQGGSYKMVVNFNTGDSSSAKVAVPSGSAYYLFGNGKSQTKAIGTGANVALNNGEAILIEQNASNPLDNVAQYVDLGYRYSMNKGSLVSGSDKFVVKLAIDDIELKQYAGYSTYGIYVETSSKSHYFDKADCQVDGNAVSIALNLGSVLTNRNTKDVFTFKAYGAEDGTPIYSSNKIVFSVSSLVKALYSDSDTKGEIKELYTYMANNGLLD